MAQPRPMSYKGQNQTLEVGRSKQDQMRVIQSNENTLKRNVLDDKCTTSHNTTKRDQNNPKKRESIT